MPVKKVGVVGSGIMGGGIAEVAAVCGHFVVLRARDIATAKGTLARIERSLDKRVEKGSLTAQEGAQALDRITPTSELSGLTECELVIESVVEDLATKKHLFAELDRTCAGGAVLVTNTSTL